MKDSEVAQKWIHSLSDSQKYTRIRAFFDRIFPYKDRIEDSILIWKYTGQKKPVFWHNFESHKTESIVQMLDKFSLAGHICQKLSEYARVRR